MTFEKWFNETANSLSDNALFAKDWLKWAFEVGIHEGYDEISKNSSAQIVQMARDIAELRDVIRQMLPYMDYEQAGIWILYEKAQELLAKE
jgi:hypothetical protein